LGACRDRAPTAAPPSPPPVDAGANPVTDTPNLLSLGGRLGLEAGNRPQGTPTVEKIFDAMRGAGVGLVDVRQNLGSAHAARYCANGRSPEGLYVMVCEYGSAEELKAGEPITRSVFQTAKGNSWQSVGTTAILMLRETDAGAAQALKVAPLLEKL
jgi:hypothetical protein